MAIRYQNNKTIIDYIDASIQYTTLFLNDKLKAIALNRIEWLQLMHLIDSDYKDSATRFVKDPSNPHKITYDDVIIFYDGSIENHQPSYLGELEVLSEEVRRFIERAERGQPNTEPVNQLTPRPFPTQIYNTLDERAIDAGTVTWQPARRQQATVAHF